MPWLVVLGDGSWVFARKRYKGGVHEIDAETAAGARSAGLRMLMVLEREPVLATPERRGPLSWEDIHMGAGGGARLAAVPDLEDGDLEPAAPAPDEPDSFICHFCPETEEAFPTAASLRYHVNRNHTPEAMAQAAAEHDIEQGGVEAAVEGAADIAEMRPNAVDSDGSGTTIDFDPAAYMHPSERVEPGTRGPRVIYEGSESDRAYASWLKRQKIGSTANW